MSLDYSNLLKFYNDNYDPISVDLLEQLKSQFAHIVNSNRNLSNIKTVTDLIRLLYKLDELDETHVKEINELINQARKPSASSYESNLFRQQQTRLDLSDIYEFICSRLGKFCYEFARNLNVPEGTIDMWRKECNYYEVTMRTLKFHERNSGRYDWRRNLLIALRKSRRSDLQKKVEEMLDHKNIIQRT